jgi:hypothetical protein
MARKRNTVASSEETLGEGTPTETVPAVENAPHVEAPKAEEATYVSVKDLEQGQEKERTYSKEVHRDGFADLAKEFCASPFNKCL